VRNSTHAPGTTSTKARRWENRPQTGELAHFDVNKFKGVRTPTHAPATILSGMPAAARPR
jgi:hypothetical protein